MARDYIARDPRTGKPLGSRRRRRGPKNLAYRPGEGRWDAIPADQVIPLAMGEVEAVEITWRDSAELVGRADGIRALPRIRGSASQAAHVALDKALGHLEPHLRIAGLASLPYCALNHSDTIFEHLHELLDDIDAQVAKAASACLVIVAPVFPSATEETMRRELRHSMIPRRRKAFEALRGVAGDWPEVAELHIDELIREEEVDLRAEAASLLPRLAKHQSSVVWDLIGWCLQDEAVEVRRNAARALPPLADHAPKVAEIALEIALFDEDDKVRKSALKAFGKIDPTAFRMRRIAADGTRHADPVIRRTCIKLLAVLHTESEARDLAAELLPQETDAEAKRLLEDLIFDASLEGTEAEKNRYLAPAPKADPPEDGFATPPGDALAAMRNLAQEKEDLPPALAALEAKKKKLRDANTSQDSQFDQYFDGLAELDDSPE